MNYNPYKDQYDSLRLEISQIKARQRGWKAQINWYKNFNLDKEIYNLKLLSKEFEDEERELLEVKSRIGESRSILVRILADREPWYKIWTGRRERQDSAINLFKMKLDRDSDLAKKISDHVVVLEVEISKGRESVESYRCFDLLFYESAIRSEEIRLPDMERRLSSVTVEKEKVDRAICVLLQKMEDLKVEQSNLEREIVTAAEFEGQLDTASDGRERAVVHSYCESRFGESSPAKVIFRTNKKLDKVRRDVDKLHRRIMNEVKVASRRVEELVFDGNNLCYSGNGKQVFIGLAALAEAVDDLACTGSIKVVFDSSIRGLLKMSDEAIGNRFPDYIEVHVVASREKADQTILSLAKDPEVFVVSNDQYLDYPDQPAVQSGRIIKHEITRGRVMIHELQVDRSYVSDRF